MPEGNVIFSRPIVGSTTHDRVILALDTEGGHSWIVGRVLRNDPTKFEREFGFTLDQVLQAAEWAISGHPEVSNVFVKQAGKALAAGMIVMAMAAAQQPVEGEEA